MLKSVYLDHFTWVLPCLIIDILIPIFSFLPKLKKKDEFKYDVDFWGFVITLVVANGLLSYVFGIFAYVKFEDNLVRSYVIFWIVSFIILVAIEFLIYFLWMKKEAKASIEISMSPNDYKELILNIERDAKTIWLMPKRIHVMFKTQAFIHYLAEKRFGVGSEYIQAYEDEHTDRKAALYRSLNNGLVMHELHNKSDLIAYIKKKALPSVDSSEKRYIIEMLTEWKRILNQFPNSYCVRLTDENIPIKYELIDCKKMVIHESVGSNSRDRLNAIMIESRTIAKRISNDFSQIWERVPANERNNTYVVSYIDTYLLPLLKKDTTIRRIK